MDLWPAVNRLWNMKAQEQAQHVRYATEFANHLKAILQNSFDHFKADRVISELCRAWMSNTQDDPSEENTESDTPMVDIQGWALVPSTLCGNLADSGWKDIKVRSLKEKVADLCAAIEDQAQKERVQQIFQQAWIEFLEKKRKKKAECRLCHLWIDCMPGEGSSSQILAQHFVTAHWSS
ncbi:hypothetical protein BKA66DRAFT_573533 [Pyrenochaeta sp. MPI-SDFR-AT-0127]|nr:hypothetical protein BKA66DRAFT_573533 [Pyrenochaeta sp. MPI-SDFR-AT-0127]